MDISPKTKHTGLIGHPVAHSMSPMIHNSLYNELGIDMVYTAFDILPENLGAAVAGMAALGFTGFNITIPYKERVIEYLDEIDPEAKAIGAVNTVKIENGRLLGYNTDGQGLIESLNRAGVEISGREILLIGAGGSARSIGIYLAKENPKKINIYNRTFDRACQLAVSVNTYKGIDIAEPVESINNSSDIIINTTSVGMWPKIDGNPLQGTDIKCTAAVCDIVYNPPVTSMLSYARDRGCKTIGGIGMLIGQGLRSVEIWLGRELPDIAWDIMYKTVK